VQAPPTGFLSVAHRRAEGHALSLLSLFRRHRKADAGVRMSRDINRLPERPESRGERDTVNHSIGKITVPRN
jgi:hypothetical protein